MSLLIKTSYKINSIMVFIAMVLAVIIFYIIVLFTIIEPLPIVAISNSQGRCKYVEIDGKEYDCSIWKDLDGRYDIVWED